MQHRHLRFGKGFRPTLGNSRSQAAQMVPEPGGIEGGPDNRHQGSDQWLFVVAGTGRAVVGGQSVTLKAGTLLLIERNEPHEIRNLGRSDLVTINFYVPPAYRANGTANRRGQAAS